MNPVVEIGPNLAPPSEVSVSRRYELVGQLDEGGMGEIFLARVGGTAGFSREVVIKRLRRKLAAEPRCVSAFVDEARLLARMSHPNVCQVHDLMAEAGQLYLVMEYLHGLTLAEIGSIGPRYLAGVAVQVLEGLHHVHSLRRPDGGPAGAIHRDISPSNLFVTSSGAVKILDFGIAKTFDSPALTPCHVIKGKRGYMSPEQMAGEPLDARSDLYALAVVLAEAGGAEAGLGEVIDRALAFDASERVGSAREMREAIERAAVPIGGPAAPSDLADWLAARFGPELERRRDRAAKARTEGGTVELEPPSDERAPVIRFGPPPPVSTARRRPVRALIGAGVVMIAIAAFALVASSGPEAPVEAAPAPMEAAPVPMAIPVPAVMPEMEKEEAQVADEKPIAEEKPREKRSSASTSTITSTKKEMGLLSIDSKPYAYVTANGKELGMTPIWRMPHRAGKVTIEAVAADGRRRSFVVTIAPGGEVRRRLAWRGP